MGMFDWVEYECECPVCGKTLNEFQSKSGDCTLSRVKPEDVNKWYDFCNKCGAWVEFEWQKHPSKEPIMTFEPKQER